MKLIDIVKGNKAVFTHYRNDNIHYDVIDNKTGEAICSVPVDIGNKEDIGNARYDAEVKASSLMRYIRKAQKDGSLAFYKITA